MLDRDLLLAEVERDPEHTWAVFHLAQSYFAQRDFVNARKWYARRAEMGGWDEEVYVSLWRIADTMWDLGMPWPEVQEAYLRAWEFRPTRAEALWSIACKYRSEQHYRLGYLFAKRAAEIPFPERDTLLVRADVHDWRAADERAVCASWIGKPADAFTWWRRVLARPDLPEGDRQRIAGNRDACAQTMLEAASCYPDPLVQRLAADSGDAEVVVSLVAGPDRERTEPTLNSFLNSCLDVSRVGRFLVIDAGLSAQDRALLLKRYGFLDFVDPGPGEGPGAHLAHLREHIDAQFWLHLGQGWQFFAPENFITRLTAVLEAEPQVFQVAINFTDAVKLTGTSAPETAVRRAPDAGRYVLTDAVARGPAMFDTARLDRAGGVEGSSADPIWADDNCEWFDPARTNPDPINELGRRATAAGLGTASLDEVLALYMVLPAAVQPMRELGPLQEHQ